MRYTGQELLDHLASSYVLGTLNGGARRRFERLQRERTDVRQHVRDWEERLGQLAVSVPPRRPSGRLWEQIAARTRPGGKPVANESPGRWSRWLLPAGFGAGGVAAGLLAAAFLLMVSPGLFISSDQAAMRSGEKLPASYVGLLTDANGKGKLLVSSLRHGRTMTIKTIGPIEAPASGTLVLWALPPTGPAFKLGTVPTSGSAVSMLPDTSEKLLSKVERLMVTVESSTTPAGPSATVVYTGNCAKLW